MGEYENSVNSALKAGRLFDISESSPFVQTVVAKAVDQYVEMRVHNEMYPQDLKLIDPSLEELVERLISNCLAFNEFKQAIGITIEAHRLDTLEMTLKSCGEALQEHLHYAKRTALKYIGRLEYQRQVLTMVANLAANCPTPDFVFVADCLVAMNDATGCAHLLERLVGQSGDSPSLRPLLLQISFNVYADATQEFLNIVKAAVQRSTGPAEFKSQILASLDGTWTTQLQLEFLYRKNAADMMVLERTKESLNAHSSMHHAVLSCANAIMHCGTTNDEFLRKNLEWLGFATNWSKFTAASSLGVIHKVIHGSLIFMEFLKI